MNRRTATFIVLTIVVVLVAGWALFSTSPDDSLSDDSLITQPQVQIILDGLVQPWDLAVADNSDIYFTQKRGVLGLLTADRNQYQQISSVPDVLDQGEGGLMGLTLDPESPETQLYVCFASPRDGGQIVVEQWTVEELNITNRVTIIDNIDYNQTSFPGRHSGCRVAFGPQGNLWVATGDAALSQTPQSPTSLAGKILRVDRDGNGVDGNLEPPFDARIFSYGHRNPQGLALFDQIKNGSFGYNAEHGSDVDDELNALVPGNFGWDPGPGYDESVPMTDVDKFPDAVSAVWSSGDSTIAVSGATILKKPAWGEDQNLVLMAVLKDQHIRALDIDDTNKVTEEYTWFDGYGRIRTVLEAPDGSVYITTDNRNDDKIIKVTPQ